MSELTDKEATTRDLRVANYSFRYVDEGAGKPILFVHGSQSDHRTWRQQMELFRKSHRVIAYSRRHHRPNLPIPMASTIPCLSTWTIWRRSLVRSALRQSI